MIYQISREPARALPTAVALGNQKERNGHARAEGARIARRGAVRSVWTLLVLLVVGCSSESAEPAADPDPEPLCPAAGEARLPASVAADGFVATTGLEFESCGREYVSFGSSCCEPLLAGYQCLLRAFEACTLARFAQVYSTIEGDLIFQDYFVVPAARGCELMVMTDRGQDAFRDPNAAAVHTAYCLTASLPQEAGNVCPRLLVEDCGSQFE